MLIDLGGLELSEGHTRVAIADFQNALALSPDQPFGLINLGSAYLNEKQFIPARQQFEKALEIPFIRAQALQALAVLDYQESRTDRVDLLRQAAQLAPEDWSIQRRYIVHLGERGQIDAAITALRVITRDQPWRADTWRLLGDFWLHVRQYDSAARAYRKAIAFDVHDDETPRKLAAIDAQLAH